MGVEGLFFAVEAFIVAIAVALAAFIADSLAIKSWWRYYGHRIMMMASPCSASSQTQSASNHDDSISMVGFVADSFGIKSWWSQHQFASHGVMTMEPPSLPLWKTHSTWFQHYFHCYLHPRLSCHLPVMIPCHHQCRFPNDQSMIMLTASPGLPCPGDKKSPPFHFWFSHWLNPNQVVGQICCFIHFSHTSKDVFSTNRLTHHIKAIRIIIAEFIAVLYLDRCCLARNSIRSNPCLNTSQCYRWRTLSR